MISERNNPIKWIDFDKLSNPHRQAIAPSIHVCSFSLPLSPHFPLQEPPATQQLGFPRLLMPQLGHLALAGTVLVVLRTVLATANAKIQ